MKVLLVWNGPANHAERDVMARRQIPLLVHLTRQGVAPTVALLGDRGGIADHFHHAGLPVALLPHALPPAPRALASLAPAAVRLLPLVHRLDPDIVEGDEPMPAIAAAFAARRRPGRVRLYRRHHHGGRRRLIVASRVAARLADRTIVSCRAMRERAIADDRTPDTDVDIATSGVCEPPTIGADTLAEARRARGIPEHVRLIVVVARLRAEKGVDVLIHALTHLHARDTHVLVIGSGPDEAALRDQAQHAPVPVHFIGHQRDGVDLWIAAADVVAMPSRREAFGRVTLEAMAAGRPLVASRVGGLVDAVVDGETGMLVPPEDPPALAAALDRVLGDAVLTGRLGAAGRARYEAHYTLQHMASSWRRAWERALAGDAPRDS